MCGRCDAQVMPLLRQILQHANDKSHRMLRAKALECISLVGMAIGRDRFREDAHAVMRYIQSLQVREQAHAFYMWTFQMCSYTSIQGQGQCRFILLQDCCSGQTDFHQAHGVGWGGDPTWHTNQRLTFFLSECWIPNSYLSGFQLSTQRICNLPDDVQSLHATMPAHIASVRACACVCMCVFVCVWLCVCGCVCARMCG